MRRLVLVACACGAQPTAKITHAEHTIADAGAPVVSILDASAEETAPPRPPPRKVLHAGDSFVGWHSGLSKALTPRFVALGATVERDVWSAVSIELYARTRRVAKLVDKHNPDMVIMTLGANDMYVPNPWSLAPFVRSIVKQIGERECYWITPLQWTKAKPTGIVETIKENAAPCKVFDGAGLDLELAGDHIHPSNAGGEAWASAFFDFWRRVR